MAETYKGTCFCGAVAIEAAGAPLDMGYCHCRSCRSHSGGPVNAFTLWKADVVKVTKGAEFLGAFNKTGFSNRRFCTKCGGHVMVDHPSIALADVFASTLPAGLQAAHPPELRRDRAADEGRPAQVQGFSRRSRRIRRDAAGIACAGAGGRDRLGA
jgi:hypothetical protein